MHSTEALRSMHEEQLEYIYQKIQVDFDNRRQQPLSFIFAHQRHTVCQVLGNFKLLPDQPANGFLVEAEDQKVFFLFYQLEKVQRQYAIEPGFWVLGFRVLADQELFRWDVEERKMLANSSLKRIADFHGHVCPELVIGSKFCAFVQRLINEGTIAVNSLAVIAENATSSLDAIQVLLGVTVGNQRLLVMDYGKHIYTLLDRNNGRGWKLALRSTQFGKEELFEQLTHKVNQHQAVLDDVIELQQVIDARVRQIIATEPEELFFITEITAPNAPQETAAVYRQCSVCGEPVLLSRSVVQDERFLCVPCLQKIAPGCTQFGVQ